MATRLWQIDSRRCKSPSIEFGNWEPVLASPKSGVVINLSGFFVPFEWERGERNWSAPAADDAGPGPACAGGLKSSPILKRI